MAHDEAIDISDALSASPSLLVPGRRVRLRGLQGRPELNGREAVIGSWVATSSRFAVHLADASTAGLAVRPENLACEGIDFRVSLGENDELLVGAIFPHLDVTALCQLRVADSRLASLVRLELRRRPLRWRFEFDWRRAPLGCRDALFEKAWSRGGFADDKTTEMFCCSDAPRAERPAELAFRVGDLFQHKGTGYLGYVVGWDSRTRAPRSWVEVHRSVHAPGTRCDRLFAPHLSVREFVPGARADLPHGIGFQTRYVIQDNLEPFKLDGVGRAEAHALQDAFCRHASEPVSLPVGYVWDVISALHNDGMLLPLCARVGDFNPLTLLGECRNEEALCRMFEALDGRIGPSAAVRAPAGEHDLVFHGSGRLLPNATWRERYPLDAHAPP